MSCRHSQQDLVDWVLDLCLLLLAANSKEKMRRNLTAVMVKTAVGGFVIPKYSFSCGFNHVRKGLRQYSSSSIKCNSVTSKPSDKLKPVLPSGDFLALPEQVREALVNIPSKSPSEIVPVAMSTLHSIMINVDNKLLTSAFYGYISYHVSKKQKHFKSTAYLSNLYNQKGVITTQMVEHFVSALCSSTNREHIPIGKIWNYIMSKGRLNLMDDDVIITEGTTPEYSDEIFRDFMNCVLERHELDKDDVSLDAIIIKSDPKMAKKLGVTTRLSLTEKIQYIVLTMVKLGITLSWKHYRVLLLAYIKENRLDKMNIFCNHIFTRKVEPRSYYSPVSAIDGTNVIGFGPLQIKHTYKQSLTFIRSTLKIDFIRNLLDACAQHSRANIAYYLFLKTSSVLDLDSKTVNSLLNSMIESKDMAVLEVFKGLREKLPEKCNAATLTIMLKGYSLFIERTEDTEVKQKLYEDGISLISLLDVLNVEPDAVFIKSLLLFYNYCNSFVDIGRKELEKVEKLMSKFEIPMTIQLMVASTMALSRSVECFGIFDHYISTTQRVDVRMVNNVLTTCLNLNHIKKATTMLEYLTTKPNDPYLATYNEDTFVILYQIWKLSIISEKEDQIPIHKINEDMETCLSSNIIQPTDRLLSVIGSSLIRYMEINNVLGETMLKNLVNIIMRYYPRELISTNPRIISLFLKTVVGNNQVDTNLLEKTILLLESFDEKQLDTVHYTQLLRIVNMSSSLNRLKLMKIILQKMANAQQYPNLVTLRMMVEILFKEAPQHYSLISYILSAMHSRMSLDREGIEKNVKDKSLPTWLAEAGHILTELQRKDTEHADEEGKTLEKPSLSPSKERPTKYNKVLHDAKFEMNQPGSMDLFRNVLASRK